MPRARGEERRKRLRRKQTPPRAPAASPGAGEVAADDRGARRPGGKLTPGATGGGRRPPRASAGERPPIGAPRRGCEPRPPPVSEAAKHNVLLCDERGAKRGAARTRVSASAPERRITKLCFEGAGVGRNVPPARAASADSRRRWPELATVSAGGPRARCQRTPFGVRAGAGAGYAGDRLRESIPTA